MGLRRQDQEGHAIVKVITLTYANAVEALVLVNDDDAEQAHAKLAAANPFPLEITVQALAPDTLQEAINYLETFE